MSGARVVRADSPEWLGAVVGVLARGGLVAFPTDTVYGVGANAFDPVAVALIYKAKGRREENPIPVLVAGEGEIDRLSVGFAQGVRRLARAFWPGPLTLVVPRRPGLPLDVSPGPTVGLRAPDHAVPQEILRAAGPLATSSANRSGELPARTASEVQAALEGRIDLIVDGGTTPGGRPSTVLDCTLDPPQVLREGPVAWEEIQAVWEGLSRR